VNGTEPCPVKIKGVIPNPYEPGNYEGSKGSVGPIENALAKSFNCAFVRLGLSLDDNLFKSMDKVAEMARRMGITIPDDGKYGPSIALGAKEVTPLQMAAAYAALANDGVRHDPYFVEKVVDRNGKEVLTGRNDGKRVVDANVARAAVSAMRKVVEGGTGTKARLRDRQVAGKTGTSQEWRDAWFVGFTPQLSTAVWMGNPNKQDSMKNVGGIRVTGGSYPAAVWGAYMTEAMAGVPVLKFTEPDLKAFGKAKTVKVPKEVGGGSGPPTTKKPTETTLAPSDNATPSGGGSPPTTSG
jgi:penicillin-binding protein 1A